MAGSSEQPRSNGASRKKVYGLRKKVYVPSECVLTSERENGNVYAVGLFNMVAAHAIVVPLAILVNDSYKAGRLSLDLEVYHFIVGSPWEWAVVAGILLAEFLLSFLVYFSFLLWAACYRRFGTAANYVFLILLLLCVFVSRRVVFLAVFDLQLHPAGRITCCVQMLALCMKWVSFVHENSYKVLYPWHKEDETGPAVWYGGQMEPHIGSFSSYVYFLFCPVLLYRDRYPRKPRNFQRAVSYFIQFLMSNVIAHALFRELLIPHSMHMDDLVVSWLRCVFLGFVQLSLAHTCLMHGWMNAWAELLGFADRSFYQDWWNSENLGEYLCKWNPVVQEWLKVYLYSHVKKWLPRLPALLLVLVVSSVEHDLLVSTGLGFFMPLYLVEYGIGGFLLSLKPSLGKKTDQFIMSVLLCTGSGIQIAVYCTEIVARTHCRPDNYTTTSWLEGPWSVECFRRFN